MSAWWLTSLVLAAQPGEPAEAPTPSDDGRIELDDDDLSLESPPHRVEVEGGGVVSVRIPLPGPVQTKALGTLRRAGRLRLHVMEHEVTQAQWEAVMGSNPSRFSGCPTCPVESVSWHQAVAFAEAVSAMEDCTYRLPTEEEWELLVGQIHVERRAWTGWDRSESGPRRPRPVCTKERSNWGLCDIMGNVTEWTMTPDRAERRIVKGCGYRDLRADCHPSFADALRADARRRDVGFRLIRSTCVQEGGP